MIRVAGLNTNDVVNGEGICVSLFLQGCPHHCKGCFSQKTWNPKGGEAWHEDDLILEIRQALEANGILRNLSILGGEPLDTDDKILFLYQMLSYFATLYQGHLKVFLWTGYTYKELLEKSKTSSKLKWILNHLTYLIEGPFILEERDITLKWRGSRNQNIINMKTGEIEND